MKPGTIALDIDGTITDKTHLIPDEVANFFETLSKKGWKFIFMTGRPLSFAMRTLPKLTFPYLLGVQNGADLLRMPEKERVGRFYLDLLLVKEIDHLYKEEEGGLLVYSGYDHGDICYFCPDHFSQETLSYLNEVEKLSDAPWAPLKTFEEVEQKSFPLIKCLGSKEGMERFNKKLEGVEGIKATFIKDPLSELLYLILITYAEADKGLATKRLMESHHLNRPLITGGNDNNDIPLLKIGDRKIAIEGSPKGLMEHADIIAPSAEKGGIIEGIEEAMKRFV